MHQQMTYILRSLIDWWKSGCTWCWCSKCFL